VSSYDSLRMIGRSSLGTIQPKTLFQNTMVNDDTSKDDFSLSQSTGIASSHGYGSQMNKLITSMKPSLSIKAVSFRLSSNALKYLFPIS